MNQQRQLLLIMKISGRLKIFLILGMIETKSNIGLNRLVKMKTGNNMLLLDLIII